MMQSGDLTLAIDAAKIGGKIVADNFGKAKEITTKGDKGFVTEIDKASEAAIIAHLQKNSDYSVLAEESGKSGTSDNYWVIDPLDGTTNFSRGIPLCAVNVALVKDDEIIVGVTFDPLRDECFSAEKGEGAFLNGKAMKVSDKTALRGSVAFVEMGYSEGSSNKFALVAGKMVTVCYVRKLGSTALEFCYVAAGRAEAFITVGDELWDIASGILLVKESGGLVTDWHGKVEDTDNDYILASNKATHELIAEQIAEFQA